MSLLIQTIIIGVIALIINFFSPTVADWFMWGGYLVFSMVLFFKGLEYRKKLRRGEQSDLSGAVILPFGSIGVIIILIIFLFINISKFHLLWVAPLVMLIFEILIGRRTWKTFESNLLGSASKKEG